MEKEKTKRRDSKVNRGEEEKEKEKRKRTDTLGRLSEDNLHIYESVMRKYYTNKGIAVGNPNDAMSKINKSLDSSKQNLKYARNRTKKARFIDSANGIGRLMFQKNFMNVAGVGEAYNVFGYINTTTKMAQNFSNFYQNARKNHLANEVHKYSGV